LISAANFVINKWHYARAFFLTEAGFIEDFSACPATGSPIVRRRRRVQRSMTLQSQLYADRTVLPNLRLTNAWGASGKKNASRQNLILQ
jgi:hypothetical protein